VYKLDIKYVYWNYIVTEDSKVVAMKGNIKRKDAWEQWDCCCLECSIYKMKWFSDEVSYLVHSLDFVWL